MRIYPTEKGVVFIDRTKLGDWGTKGKPVPLVAVDVHRQSAAKASFVSCEGAWSYCGVSRNM